MTPFVSHLRPRRDVSLFLPLLLLAIGLGVLMWTLPLAGVRIPGMSRVTRLIDSISFPWEPPRPVHVPLPEGMSAAPPANAPAVTAPVAAAPVAAQPAAAPVAALDPAPA